MPDYDLGKAHGRIVIDYDKKGTDEAQEEFGNVEDAAGKLHKSFETLRKFFKFFSSDFSGHATKWSAALGVLAGGSAILLGMTRAMGGLNGRMLKLRGGMSILRSVSLLFGGLPKSVEGFPKIIKQIIKLSAAITLLHQSSKLMNSVFIRFGKFLGSTRIIQTLTAAFPALTAQIAKLAGFIPSIGKIGNMINNLGKPIHQIARAALAVGTLISLWKTGTKVAWQLAKGIGAIGAAGFVLQTLIVLTSGLVDATLELSGALGLIPGIYATIGAIKGTLAVGLAGFKDAMKHLDDAEKFEEDIKKLAPSAQQAARAIRDLSDEWKDMQRNVQEQLFAGVAKQIRQLAAIYLPLMRKQMGLLAIDLNTAAKEVSAFMQRGETVRDVNKLFEGSRTIVQNLTKALAPLLQALLDIVVVSQEALVGLTGGAGNAAQAFADFIRNARETGKLREWIENGITAIERLVQTVINLGIIFKTIFDAFDTSGGGFLQMLNNMTYQIARFLQSAKGQDVLNTLVELLNTLTGATHAVLAAGLGELLPIIGSLLPLIKELATTFSGVLVVAIKILGPIINALAKALSFLAPVIGPILGVFLALSIASKALMIGFGLLFGVVFKGIAVINALGFALQILGKIVFANPILTFIALLATAILIVITNWDKFAPVLTAIWEWIRDTAVAIWTGIVDFFVGLWEGIADFFTNAWNDIASDATSIWNGIIDFFTGIWDAVSSFFVDTWNDITTFLVDTWNSIVEATRGIWEPIVSIFQSIFSILRDLVIIIFGGIAIFFIEIWNAIKNGVVEAWEFISGWLTLAWQGILTAFHAIWDPIVEFFSFIWSGITNIATAAWTAISEWFSARWAEFTAAFNVVWTNISNFFRGIWNGIKNTVINAWTVAQAWFQARMNAVGNWFRNLWNGIASFFSSIWNSRIVTAVRNGVSTVINWIASLPGKIWGLVKDAGSWLINAGKAVIEGFLNGLKSAFQSVADWVGGVADWVSAHKGPLDYDRRLLVPAGQAIMQGLLGGLQSKEAVIISFLEGLTKDIQGGLTGATDKLKGAAGEIAGTATLGIVTSLPTNAEAVASSVPTAPARQSAVPVGGDGAAVSTTSTIEIDTLILQVTGNLDPTDPVKWDKAIKGIRDGIRGVERAEK
jgi:phage-related protein